jgi:hypothetical protein
MNVGQIRFAVQGSDLETIRIFADGLPHSLMATRVMSSGRQRLYVDGVQQGSAFAGTASLTCSQDFYLGSTGGLAVAGTLGFWSGDLFELCAYDRVLNQVERNLIDASFAGRHGVEPSSALYGFVTTHGAEVAGIGRDPGGAVVDRAEGRGIVRVSAPSALSDGDYLLWGADRAADFSLSTDVPPPLEWRLSRTWAYTVTDGGALDGVGTVDLRFRIGGLFLSRDPDDFALLFDADGTFANAAIQPASGVYDGELEAIEFRQVQLAPQGFIGLAVRPL